MAVTEKRSMLNRSTDEFRRNFASEVAKVREDTNGYAAKIEFAGEDRRSLVALIDDDCYIGWTGSEYPLPTNSNVGRR